jgi:hypothetical protein
VDSEHQEQQAADSERQEQEAAGSWQRAGNDSGQAAAGAKR